MSVEVKAIVRPHEVDFKRIPIDVAIEDCIVVKSTGGTCVVIEIAGRHYELHGQDLIDAIRRCIQ